MPNQKLREFDYPLGTYFVVHKEEFLKQGYFEVYQAFDRDGEHIDELSYEAEENNEDYIALRIVFNEMYDNHKFYEEQLEDGGVFHFSLT